MSTPDLEPVSPPKIGGSLPHDEYIRALYSIAKSLKRTADETPTLRDYFAGQALTGLASNTNLLLGIDKLSKGDPRGGAAAIAYSLADALLAHRGKGQ